MNKRSTSDKSVIPGALAVAAAYSVGLWGLYLQPQLLSPLMEKLQVTETEVGALYGVENFIYFITLLLTTIPVTKYSRTKINFHIFNPQ